MNTIRSGTSSGFAVLVFLGFLIIGGDIFGDEQRPRVAVAGFTTNASQEMAIAAVADFSELLEVVLAEASDFEVVSRESIARGMEELHLSAFGLVEQRTAVRLGAWAGADLLVTGRFQQHWAEDPGIQVELIDLARGDLLAERFYPGDPGPLANDLGFVQTAADDIRTFVADAVAYLESVKSKRVVAPLFFSNAGSTPRLDFFEGVLFQTLQEHARASEEVRLVTFPRAERALGEAELILTGLVAADANAWERVADVYVWGAIQEIDPEGVAFDDVEVSIDLHIWEIGREPRVVSMSGRVRNLEAVAADLARQVIEDANMGPEAEADDARRVVAGILWERAEEIGDAASGSGEHARRMENQRLRILTATCFFDPANADAQWERIEATWPSRMWRETPALLWLYVWDHLEYAEAHLSDIEDRQTYLNREIGVIQAILDAARGTMSASRFIDLRRQWRNDLLDEFIRRVDTLNQVVADWEPGERRTISSKYSFWMSSAVNNLSLSRERTVAIFEVLWPNLRKGFMLYNELRATSEHSWGHRVNLAYQRSGRSQRFDEILEESRRQEEEDWEPPTPREIRLMRAKSRSEQGESEPDIEPPDDLLAETPLLRVAQVRYALRPEEIIGTTGLRASVGGMTASRARGFIHGLYWHDGHLWIAEAGSMIYSLSPEGEITWNTRTQLFLWRYNPALNELVLANRANDVGRRVTDVLQNDHTFWVTTRDDGIRMMDPGTGDIRRIDVSDGLVSRHKFAAAATDESLFFGGGNGETTALTRYDPESESWTGMKFGGDRLRDAPNDESEGDDVRRISPWEVTPKQWEITRMAVWRNWLLVEADGLFYYDLDTKEWILPDVRDDHGNTIDTGNVYAMISGPDGFWIGCEHGLLLSIPNPSRDPDHSFYPVGPVQALTAGPDGIWLAIGTADHRDVDPTYSSDRRFENLEAMKARSGKADLVYFDKLARRPLGRIWLDEGVTALTVTDSRLWAALRDTTPPLVEIRLNDLSEHIPVSGRARTEPIARRDRPPLVRLAEAASVRDAATVDALLVSGGIDLNVPFERDWTVLHAAVRGGDARIVTKLLAAGSNPNVSTEEGYVPLSMAVYYRNLAAIRALLQQGADIDYQGARPTRIEKGEEVFYRFYPYMRTALMVAAMNGFDEIVAYLLQAGADPNLPDSHGVAPVERAAENGHWEIAGRLLESGADLFHRAPDYSPVFQHAVGQGEIEWVRLLLERGQNIEETWHGGSSGDVTALMVAAGAGNRELMDLLLRFGADVNTVIESDGRTALSTAVAGSHYDIVRFLLESGFDPERPYGRLEGVPRRRLGDEAILNAARNPLVPLDVVELLLDAGADVNAENNQNYSPLMYAAHNGHLNLVELLIERGASVTTWNQQGARPHELAQGADVRQVLRATYDQVMERRSVRTGEQTSSHVHHTESGVGIAPPKNGNASGIAQDSVIQSVRDLEREIHEDPNYYSERLFRLDADATREDIEELLAKGADIDYRVYNTPLLEQYVLSERYQLARVIVEMGADVNLDTRHRGPLLVATLDNIGHLTSERDRSIAEFASFLIDHGADVDATFDLYGYTALIRAARYGAWKTLETLIERGADPGIRDNEGKTALDHIKTSDWIAGYEREERVEWFRGLIDGREREGTNAAE